LPVIRPARASTPRLCHSPPRHSDKNVRRGGRSRGHHVMANLLQDQQSSSRYVAPGIRSPYAAGRGRSVDASCCRSASARAFDGTSNRFAWSMAATWPPGSAAWLPDAWSASFLRPPTEWRRQFVFPAARICRDPRFGSPSRYHLHDVCGAAMVTDAARRAGVRKRVSKRMTSFVTVRRRAARVMTQPAEVGA